MQHSRLKLELHPDKSRIIPLSKGIDFVGFRNFYHFKLVRKRNMKRKIASFTEGKSSFYKMLDSFQGWQAYAFHTNSFELREKLKQEIIKILFNKI